MFYVNQYFQDSKNAFEKYYMNLKPGQSGVMVRKFGNALCSLNSSMIGRVADICGKSI